MKKPNKHYICYGMCYYNSTPNVFFQQVRPSHVFALTPNPFQDSVEQGNSKIHVCSWVVPRFRGVEM